MRLECSITRVFANQYEVRKKSTEVEFGQFLLYRMPLYIEEG
jgi:hypothetical protein